MTEPRGSPIPGSRFLRDYCVSCGEPIRVIRLYDDNGAPLSHECNQCGHRPPPGHYGPTDDTSPAWDNAVRALEDNRE